RSERDLRKGKGNHKREIIAEMGEHWTKLSTLDDICWKGSNRASSTSIMAILAHQVRRIYAERFDARSGEGDDADQRILVEQRHTKHCPLIAEPHCFNPGVFGVGRRIFDMHRTPLQDRSARQCPTVRSDRIARLEIPVFCRYPERSNHSAEAVVQPEDESGFGQANARRRCDQPVQHRPELGTRLADDLQHVARRGLVFERLLQSGGTLAELAPAFVEPLLQIRARLAPNADSRLRFGGTKLADLRSALRPLARHAYLVATLNRPCS